MNTNDDLTEHWPDDPENAELARFAGDLQAALPELPEAALTRIEQRLAAESHVSRWPWRQLTAAGIAAAALVALGWWGRGLWVRDGSGPDLPTAQIEDRIPVAFVPGIAVSSDRPLVRPADYQSLFETAQ